MFDFSFGELLVIGGVALVVIGPEKLPKVARTVGAMLARAQRYVNGVKADIQREVELDNLRRIEAEMNEAGRKLASELGDGLNDMQQSVSSAANDFHAVMHDAPSKSSSELAASDTVAAAHEAAASSTGAAERPERDRR
ncbi:Sec-independent protein translocase protein TatB [Chitinimonas sp.]|uniref:Sec-independent protein translocase protein TatB n=1 Tax=Chitinimonas sp. TaxID=1934313 RepID=UPI0035AE9617